MMYFTPIKTAVILGLCLLGALLCIPNLFPAPAPWLPWRQVHLGLDLRGGSYLLLEVDMKAVVKERLDSMVDAVRQALRPSIRPLRRSPNRTASCCGCATPPGRMPLRPPSAR